MDTRYVLVKAHLLKHSAPAVLQPAHPAQDSRGEKTEHTTHVGVLLQVVALGNLLPPDSNVDELDSYMYQTVRLGTPLRCCLACGEVADIGQPSSSSSSSCMDHTPEDTPTMPCMPCTGTPTFLLVVWSV